MVIQDVHAVPEICMDRIRDLAHYHKMVKNGTTSSSMCCRSISSSIKPHIVSSLVKKVIPYDTVKFENVRFPVRPFDRSPMTKGTFVGNRGRWSRIQRRAFTVDVHLLSEAPIRSRLFHIDMDAGLPVQQRLR